MKDLTLQMFLLQELPCSRLDSADHVSLAALDMPGGKSVLAEHVDAAHFEHIRLRPITPFQMDIIQALVTRYYETLEYSIIATKKFAAGFCMIIKVTDHQLTIVAGLEHDGILNMTVT